MSKRQMLKAARKLRRRLLSARPTSRRHSYRIVTGHAGFIQLFKDGERVQPKNFKMEFRV